MGWGSVVYKETSLAPKMAKNSQCKCYFYPRNVSMAIMSHLGNFTYFLIETSGSDYQGKRTGGQEEGSEKTRER